jgi:hypothetical protein
MLSFPAYQEVLAIQRRRFPAVQIPIEEDASNEPFSSVPSVVYWHYPSRLMAPPVSCKNKPGKRREEKEDI